MNSAWGIDHGDVSKGFLLARAAKAGAQAGKYNALSGASAARGGSGVVSGMVKPKMPRTAKRKAAFTSASNAAHGNVLGRMLRNP